MQSVNMSLDDTDESEFMETVAAGISQLERKRMQKELKLACRSTRKWVFG